MTSIIIPPGVSNACFQVLTVDDDIVEGNETFTVMMETEDPNDFVNGTVSVIVSDNDGSYIRFLVYSMHLLSYYWIKCFTGVNLEVIHSISVAEGRVQEICVRIEDLEQTRERDIPIFHFVVTHTANTSMWSFL